MPGFDGFSRKCGSRQRGFTLLELLTVIAIIAIISSMVFGLGRHVSESSRVNRAVAELAALSAILENYRRAHGDFPRTDDSAELLQALVGRRDPLLNSINTRSLVDVATFTLEGGRDPFSEASTRLVDPWGRAYIYAYRSMLPWNNSGYLLFSAGPDGRAAPLLTGGFPNLTAQENYDNLFAN